MWRAIRSYPLVVLAVVVALWEIGIPLGMLVAFSFRGGSPASPGPWSFSSYISAYSNTQVYAMLATTGVLALLATVSALALALGLAYLIERTDMPMRNVAWGLAVLPLALPNLVLAMGWVLLLNPANGAINLSVRALLSVAGVQITEGPLEIYSYAGLYFLETLSGVSTLFLMVSGAMRRVDTSIEESASMSGASWITTLRRITLPVLTPAILGAFIFGFMRNLESLEIPMVIGVPVRIYVLSSYVYFVGLRVSPPNYGVGAALGSMFLVVSVLLILWYRRATAHGERFQTIGGKGYRQRTVQLGRWRYPALGVFLLYFVLLVLLPFLAVLWRSLIPFAAAPSLQALQRLSINNYRLLFLDDRVLGSVGNTILVGAGAALLTMSLSLVVSWLIVRTKVPGRAVLDGVMFLPQAIPGVLIGLAFLVLYLTPPFNNLPIFGTVTIVVLALTAHYLAFGTRLMNGAIAQVHRELEEGAETSGASWFQRMRRILLPLVFPSLVSGLIWVAAHSLRSFSVPVMLASGNNDTVAVLLWKEWSEGRQGQAGALAIMLMLVVGVLAVGSRVLTARAEGQASS